MPLSDKEPATTAELKVHDQPQIAEYHHGEVEAVPIKYRGTEADKEDMAILGKQQVLKREFNFITILGFTTVTVCSWEFSLPLLAYGLIDGGYALLFWGYLALAIGQSLVYASMAEMAPMSPTAGGQYHWVSELAPPRYQKILSYMTGWITAAGWQVGLAGTAFITGTTIQSLLVLNYESYVWEEWHSTLLAISILAIGIIFNTRLILYLPTIEGFLLGLHIVAFLVIVIPLWVTAPHGSAKDVILTFSNNGGWPSTGLSAMIGLSGPVVPLIGFDCTVHMSEEIRDSSRVLPKAMMWGYVMNLIMAFVTMITLAFSVGNIDELLATNTRSPWVQLIFNATQSYGGTNTMVSLVIILLISTTFNGVATSSRQLWSFSRDGGFPFSKFTSKINKKWNIPLRAIWLIIIAAALISCVDLGSTAALNAFSSLGGVGLITSYYVSIACMIYRRVKGPPLPPRRWSLGKYGLIVNIIALIFLTPVWFFIWWPLITPVTAMDMNWASVMFAGLMIIATLFYIVKARHGQYVGPVATVKRN